MGSPWPWARAWRPAPLLAALGSRRVARAAADADDARRARSSTHEVERRRRRKTTAHSFSSATHPHPSCTPTYTRSTSLPPHEELREEDLPKTWDWCARTCVLALGCSLLTGTPCSGEINYTQPHDSTTTPNAKQTQQTNPPSKKGVTSTAATTCPLCATSTSPNTAARAGPSPRPRRSPTAPTSRGAARGRRRCSRCRTSSTAAARGRARLGATTRWSMCTPSRAASR